MCYNTRRQAPIREQRNGTMTVKKTEHFLAWESNLKEVRAKLHVQTRVRRLSLGNPGDVKPVGEGVSELRIHYGPGYRVYFTQRGTEIVVLLVGGTKKTQTEDINLAKLIAKDIWEQ